MQQSILERRQNSTSAQQGLSNYAFKTSRKQIQKKPSISRNLLRTYEEIYGTLWRTIKIRQTKLWPQEIEQTPSQKSYIFHQGRKNASKLENVRVVFYAGTKLILPSLKQNLFKEPDFINNLIRSKI